MEDSLLIDAVERFVKGEMSPEEKTYFEEIRKNNPELDQAVVEHIFFINELEKFNATRNFTHAVQETEAKLIQEGFIAKKFKGKAKVVHLWNRYKRTIGVAASIAGIVSLFIASLISAIHTDKNPNIVSLVGKLDNQEKKIDKQALETAELKSKVAQITAVSPVIPKTRVESNFRATGFLIDASNNFIVTNAHVVKEAKNKLIVENNKGEQFIAKAVYVNVLYDLAILKVTDNDFKKLSPFPYTIRKTNAELGEQFFMLGYPKQEIVYGEGYISAKNGYRMDTVFCQLSTSANVGNSGSPIINKKGEILGIINSMESNAEGVVFAIKSVNIYRAVEELKKLEGYEDIKITSSGSIKGLDRESQIRKVEDYVFMIKGN
ncbi:MAG: serine protease [Ferruginibacter sp.]